MADLSLPEKRATRKIEIGDTFERLTVVGPSDRPRFWMCRCECGYPEDFPVHWWKLANGHTRSCGCLRYKRGGKVDRRRTIHGESSTTRSKSTPEYQTWSAIKGRCHNPRNKDFPDYGGRNIKVCELWRNDYHAFLSYMGRRPGPEYSIDRLDNDGDYEPGNTEWRTKTEQKNNCRNNVTITHDGKNLTVAQWSRETGLPWHVIMYRFKKGWPVHRVLTEPLGASKGHRRKQIQVITAG